MQSLNLNDSCIPCRPSGPYVLLYLDLKSATAHRLSGWSTYIRVIYYIFRVDQVWIDTFESSNVVRDGKRSLISN